MSRYTVEQTDDTFAYRVRDNVDGDWITTQSGVMGLHKAEAYIIAFALNAVTEGYVLRYRSREWDHTEHSYVTVDYDGPTEGVA